MRICTATVFALLAIGTAGAKTTAINSPASFQSALANAEAGDTLEFAPGQFGAIQISSDDLPKLVGNSTLTLTSRDHRNPAKLTSLKISSAKNLQFQHFRFDSVGSKGKITDQPLVTLVDCQNISFEDNQFDGDLTSGTAKEDRDGFPEGIGIRIDGSEQITIKHNEFTRFSRAIEIKDSVNFAIVTNAIHSIRSYGIDVLGARNARISGNHIHDFLRSDLDTDGHNMIHFATDGARIQTEQISIRDNFLDAGTGPETQSIFLGNETDGSGKTARPSPLEDVNIVGNVIRNGHIHGISIAGGDGVKIESNTLLQLTNSLNLEALDVPHILFDRSVRNLTIRYNLVPHLQHEFRLPNRSWTFSGNYEIQRYVPAANNHYQNIFVNALADKSMSLEDLAIQPGSRFAMNNLGSPLLHFDARPLSPAGYIKNVTLLSAGLKQELTVHPFDRQGPIAEDDVLSVDWDFGDEKHVKSKHLSIPHHYGKRGTYDVVANIETQNHSMFKISKTIQVGN